MSKMRYTKELAKNPDLQNKNQEEEDQAFNEVADEQGLLDEAKFEVYRRKLYEIAKERKMGSNKIGEVEPSSASISKWYAAINGLKPEVEGISKDDIIQ